VVTACRSSKNRAELLTTVRLPRNGCKLIINGHGGRYFHVYYDGDESMALCRQYYDSFQQKKTALCGFVKIQMIVIPSREREMIGIIPNRHILIIAPNIFSMYH
jgi:hypothetical protein